MKRILLSILFVLAAVMSFATGFNIKPQVSTKSYSTSWTDTNFSIRYVNDGVNSLAGIDITAFKTFLGVPKLSLDSINTTSLDAAHSKYYSGALLDYRVYDRGGWKVGVGAGLKGVDVSNLFAGDFSHALANKQFIWSIGVTIPFKS